MEQHQHTTLLVVIQLTNPLVLPMKEKKKKINVLFFEKFKKKTKKQDHSK